MPDALIVFTTFASEGEARAVVVTLLEERLAACGTLLPAVQSIYRWQGAIESNAETMAVLKTTEAVYDAFEKRLRELHPYDTPEIVALPAEHVSAPYLAWLRESCAEPPPEDSSASS